MVVRRVEGCPYNTAHVLHGELVLVCRWNHANTVITETTVYLVQHHVIADVVELIVELTEDAPKQSVVTFVVRFEDAFRQQSSRVVEERR